MEPSDKEIEEYFDYLEKAEMHRPDIVFKYKSVMESRGFAQVLEIIRDSRIYMPIVEQLNDPFEGGNVQCFSVEANKRINEYRKTHRVLSLSATCFSPLMWAHYSCEGNGVCIGFYSNNSFAQIHPVEYIDSIGKKQWIMFEEANVSSWEYKCKSKEWSYEKEYRIENDCPYEFFNFESSDFACVIVGNNVSEDVRRVLIEEVEDRMPIFSLIPDFETRKYYIIPMDDQSIRIYDNTALEEYLEKQDR